MQITRLGRRYSKALFDAALEQKSLDDVKKDIEAILELFKENEGLTKIFVSPVVSKQDKLGLIENLFEKKMKLHPLLINFISLIVEKYRESILFESLEYYIVQYHKHKGIQEAELVMAEELPDKTIKDIEKKLNNLFNLKFLFHKRIDPEILGGFIVKFEDKVIDASVKASLNKLKQKLVAGEI